MTGGQIKQFLDLNQRQDKCRNTCPACWWARLNRLPWLSLRGTSGSRGWGWQGAGKRTPNRTTRWSRFRSSSSSGASFWRLAGWRTQDCDIDSRGFGWCSGAPCFAQGSRCLSFSLPTSRP